MLALDGGGWLEDASVVFPPVDCEPSMGPSLAEREGSATAGMSGARSTLVVLHGREDSGVTSMGGARSLLVAPPECEGTVAAGLGGAMRLEVGGADVAMRSCPPVEGAPSTGALMGEA